ALRSHVRAMLGSDTQHSAFGDDGHGSFYPQAAAWVAASAPPGLHRGGRLHCRSVRSSPAPIGASARQQQAAVPSG
ncbi:unnamed protein product, partial [Polarella glacialis]